MDPWFVLFVLALAGLVFALRGWSQALKGWKKANELGATGAKGWELSNNLAAEMQAHITEQQEELHKWRTAFGPIPPETTEPEPGGFLN